MKSTVSVIAIFFLILWICVLSLRKKIKIQFNYHAVDFIVVTKFVIQVKWLHLASKV